MIVEETFACVFGRPDWAVMFVLARGGHLTLYCGVTAARGSVHTRVTALFPSISASTYDYRRAGNPGGTTLPTFVSWTQVISN